MSTSAFRVIPEALRHWAQHDPDTAAFVFVDSRTEARRVLTRADIFRLAGRFAALLRRQGVRQGEVVANTLPNSPERVVTDLGAILAGAVTMNGQVFLADGEDFLGSLRRSSAVAVVLDPRKEKGAAAILGLRKSQGLTADVSLQPADDQALPVNLPSLPSLRLVFSCLFPSQGEVPSLMEYLEAQTESYVNEDVKPDDVALVWTTSGTTGYTKLVPQTHRRLLLDFNIFRVFCGEKTHQKDDVTEEANPTTPGRKVRKAELVMLNNSPLGWSGGYPAEVFVKGATRVMLDVHSGPPPDLPRALWRAAAEEGCIGAFFLPMPLNMILERTDLWAGQSFRFKAITVVGQPIHADLVRRTVGNLAEFVFVGYGSADTGGLTTKMVTWETADLYDDFNCGKPIPGVELKIVALDLPDDQDEVDDSEVVKDEDELTAAKDREEKLAGPGELGEILVRSPRAVTSYFSQEEATRKLVRPGGWVTVGDVGYLDAAGDLHVVCRAANAIQHGAFLLYPGWLEGLLRQHPALRDVLVVPVPDPVLHEELCACVVPEAEVTEEELRRWCQALFLTAREDPLTTVPRYFLFFPGGLPLTPMGKTCRRSTAAEALKRLGMGSASLTNGA